MFGGKPSKRNLVTAPFAPFTSIQKCMCGLVHSTLVTVPDMVSGLLESYSAANEWCADTGTARQQQTARKGTTLIRDLARSGISCQESGISRNQRSLTPDY